MRYAGIIFNDTAAAPGISVSFFTQGCPHHCVGCHNPETWDFDGGKEFTPQVLDDIITGLNKNGIHRSFCLMGGEPLCEENEFLSCLLVQTIKERSPQTKIYIWTGYTYEQLIHKNSSKINYILESCDFLIDGPFIQSKRDITLKMRGSANQRIIDLKNLTFE